MKAREKAESIVREFLGLESYQGIPTNFMDLVFEIQKALENPL